MMVGTKTRFTNEEAPCGRIVDGEQYKDRDDEGLMILVDYYACGCRRTRHEYHDGSVQTRAIRHDGHKVKEPFGPDHGC